MLTKGQLLDRMEILYPNDSRFSDLRRAYIDRDASSIFRVLREHRGKDVDDIRKLFMEQNLHVLFRVMEGLTAFNFDNRDSDWLEESDFRKLIMDDNIWSLYRLILDIQPTQIVKAIKSLHAKGIRINKDALSQGQLKSKMWLIEELKRLNLKLGTVFLCAGWYGILSVLLFERGFDIDKLRSFDIDPDACRIADKFNLPWFTDGWKFKAIEDDIHNINFESHDWQAWSNSNERMSHLITDIPDTIINTSCEHIENFDEWYAKIPEGKLVILQSNDFIDIDEHVNTQNTLYDFTVSTPMTKYLFSGELPLGEYTRYMRIGYR